MNNISDLHRSPYFSGLRSSSFSRMFDDLSMINETEPPELEEVEVPKVKVEVPKLKIAACQHLVNQQGDHDEKSKKM